MARSFFSVSQVCRILCGDDSDEEYVFPDSDDDLGMEDMDDDDLSGDDDSSFQMHEISSAIIPADEFFEQPASPPPGPCDVQPGPLPGHSDVQPGPPPGPQPGLLLGPSGLQSTPSGLHTPSQLEPPLPSPPSPQTQTQSRRGRARPTRGRVPQSPPRHGRAQSSRAAGGETGGEWSCEPSEVTVQPFTMAVGPTVPMSADPMEMFSHFCTPELVDLNVLETNRYATLCLSSVASAGRPVRSWETNAEELRAYLGFSMLMGLNCLPDLYDYWSLDECYHYFPVASRISRKRFLEIQPFLHFTDTTTVVPRGEPGYDCLARIRPVITAVHDTFLANYRPHRDNAIDEAMIKFKGRSVMKQYVPLKPTKRGFKVWARADAPEKYLGEKVVKKLTRPLVGGNYHIYCDNFFTTVNLFDDLLEDGIYACGTFRRDRRGIPEALKKPGNCHLQRDKSYIQITLCLVS